MPNEVLCTVVIIEWAVVAVSPLQATLTVFATG